MVEWIVGIVFGLIVLAPITLTLTLLVYAARAATLCVGKCRRCGYDLRGLGDVRACPECGKGFVVNGRGDAIS